MDGNQPLRAEEKLLARDGKDLQHDITAVAADHAIKRQLARFASRLEQPLPLSPSSRKVVAPDQFHEPSAKLTTRYCTAVGWVTV